MKRTFCISMEGVNPVPVVCEETDVLGVIGETLRLISQLDLDESVVITCIDQKE